MRYIYGPIRSRRLGWSLGVSVTPYKVCSFDCAYCQLGLNTVTTTARKEYVPSGEVIAELKTWASHHPSLARKIDYITFSGSGEPTLHSRLGFLIDRIRKVLPAKIAVITNSSLVGDPRVRRELLKADMLMPSLDAVDRKLFLQVDRPHRQVDLERIVNGLIALRREFKGEFWLEVMLIKGINDSQAHIHQLKQAIDRINPDRIQLNSPVRAPSFCKVSSVDQPRLQQIAKLFGPRCEIV